MVIAVGGSIIYPDGIDVVFVRKFKKFVEKFTENGKQFVFIIGGGRLARDYNKCS